MSRLGQQLKALRGSLSLFDVEKGTGIHRYSISRYEAGSHIPSPEQLRQLADYYGTTYTEVRRYFYEDLWAASIDEQMAMKACVIANS
jgi:transcriptional regulator with XRE-family HTH domain